MTADPGRQPAFQDATFVIERVRVTNRLPTWLSAWRQLQHDGWDVTVLLAHEPVCRSRRGSPWRSRGLCTPRSPHTLREAMTNKEAR